MSTANAIDIDWVVDAFRRRHAPSKDMPPLDEELIQILLGRKIVLVDGHGEISIGGVCDYLVDSLDAADLKSAVELIDSHVISIITSSNTVEPHSLINSIEAAAAMLRGRPTFEKVLGLCADWAADRTLRIELRISATQFVYDAGKIGDAPDFWISLWDGAEPGAVRMLPTIVLAVGTRWPEEALEFLFSALTQVPPRDEEVAANFIALSADRLTFHVTRDLYNELYHRYSDGYSEILKEACRIPARLRGWDPMDAPRLQGERGTRALEPVPLQIQADVAQLLEGVQYLRSSGNLINVLREYGASEARKLRDENRLKSAFGGPLPQFPDSMIAGFHELRKRLHKYMSADLAGEVELSFVRTAVLLDTSDSDVPEDPRPAEVLLNAIQRRVAGIPHLAGVVRNQLKALRLDGRPFYLGASEYSQDRLNMPLVEAALRREGVMADVRRRPWESPGFDLWNEQDIRADVIIKGHWVRRRTANGVYRFSGFRVFVRLDALEEHVNSLSTRDAQTARSLIELTKRQVNIRSEIDVSKRAQLVRALGLLHARGSAFEGLTTSISNLAGDRRVTRVVSDMPNDEAFLHFIRGERPIYCGGSINSMLIETWWIAADSTNFIEILSHEEIESGQAARGHAPKFVENFLCLHNSESDAGRQAEKALVSLFRAVGRGLQGWAAELEGRGYQLNGQGPSCEAARRLLKPLPEFGSGRYSFVTRPEDPARLIATTDLYYS